MQHQEPKTRSHITAVLPEQDGSANTAGDSGGVQSFDEWFRSRSGGEGFMAVYARTGMSISDTFRTYIAESALYMESQLRAIADTAARASGGSAGLQGQTATELLLARQQVMLAALRAAQDALETLRRGHGVDVSAACYPALNLVRDAAALCEPPNAGASRD